MKYLILTVLALSAASAQAKTSCSFIHLGSAGADDGSNDNREVVTDFQTSNLNVGDSIAITPNGAYSVITPEQMAKTGFEAMDGRNVVLMVTGNGTNNVGLSLASRVGSIVSASAGSNGTIDLALSQPEGESVSCSNQK